MRGPQTLMPALTHRKLGMCGEDLQKGLLPCRMRHSCCSHCNGAHPMKAMGSGTQSSGRTVKTISSAKVWFCNKDIVQKKISAVLFKQSHQIYPEKNLTLPQACRMTLPRPCVLPFSIPDFKKHALNPICTISQGIKITWIALATAGAAGIKRELFPVRKEMLLVREAKKVEQKGCGTVDQPNNVTARKCHV